MRRNRQASWLRALACGLMFLVAAVAAADDVLVTGNVRFSDLDGSADDHDGTANGTFTVDDGNLTIAGTISCNDDPPLPSFASACDITIVVSGSVLMEPGSAIVAENLRGLGNGGAVTLDVGSTVALLGATPTAPGARISTAQVTGAGGPFAFGGAIEIAAGGFDLGFGAVVSSRATAGMAGEIIVAAGGDAVIEGLVAAGQSTTVLAGASSDGAVLDGNAPLSSGGDIELRADGGNLVIGATGVVVSQGRFGGAGSVTVEGCEVEVLGLVASVSSAGDSSAVKVRSGGGIVVDGRDLGNGGSRRGRVRADAIFGGVQQARLDLFAAGDVGVLGGAIGSTSPFVLTSRGGPQMGVPAGGTIRVLALGGAVTASGRAILAGRNTFGSQGGTIEVEARDDVTLDEGELGAIGGYNTGILGAGGAIRVRSYAGAVSWVQGIGDVRPTGTGVIFGQRGTIELTFCSSLDTAGTSFPTNGSPIPPFPVEIADCSQAAPELPEGEEPLPECADSRWCTDCEILAEVEALLGDCCATPDLVVDLRPTPGCEVVDAGEVGTGNPATCSIQAAVDFVNANGDPSPGDGEILIAVTATEEDSGVASCPGTCNTADGEVGRAPGGSGTENVVVSNDLAERLSVIGCRVLLNAEDSGLPVITVGDGSGDVAVIGISVAGSSAAGFHLVDGNSGVRVAKTDVESLGAGVSIDGSSAAASFEEIAIGPTGGSGIDVNAGSGSFGFVGATIADTTGHAIEVQGGSANLTYQGTIVNTSGRLLSVVGTSGAVELQGGPFSDTGGQGVFLQAVPGSVTVHGQTSIQGPSAAAVHVSNVSGPVTFDDLDAVTSGVPALLVQSSTGLLTVAAGTLASTGAPAAALDEALVDIDLAELSSSGSATSGLLLEDVAGSFVAAAGTIGGAAGSAVRLVGGNADVTYGGSVDSTTSRSVEVALKSGGTVTLGPVTDSGTGVLLQTNTGASVVFGGGLVLDTETSDAFTAVGGGTVTVLGAGNTIATTTGVAVTITDTAIGSGGVTFQSVSVDGAAAGIVLENTGSFGGLTVAGGTIANVPGRGVSAIGSSGLTLQGLAFVDVATTNGGDPTVANSGCGDLVLGSNLECNAAVHLVNVDGATLQGLTVVGGAQVGINLHGVTDFVLEDSVVSDVGDQPREHGIKAKNLGGTSAIIGSSITGSFSDNVHIIHTEGAPLEVLDVTGSTFAGSLQGSGFVHVAHGATEAELAIDDSLFDDNFAAGLFAGAISALGSAVFEMSINGGEFTDNNDGLRLLSAGSAEIDFSVTGVEIADNPHGGIVADLANNSTAAARLRGVISGNTVTMPEAGAGDGIHVSSGGNGATTALIDGNAVVSTTQFGILGAAHDGAGTLDLTITDNVVQSVGALFPLDGIRVNAGAISTDTAAVCADLSGNEAAGGDGTAGIRLRHRFGTTFRLPGLVGSTGADAEAHLAAQNPATTSFLATTTSAFGGGASCALPP